jgi:hypothetical protein
MAEVHHQNCNEKNFQYQNTHLRMGLLAISLKPYSKFNVFQSRILLTLNCDVFNGTHYLSTDKIFLNISTSSNTFLLDFLLN